MASYASKHAFLQSGIEPCSFAPDINCYICFESLEPLETIPAANVAQDDQAGHGTGHDCTLPDQHANGPRILDDPLYDIPSAHAFHEAAGSSTSTTSFPLPPDSHAAVKIKLCGHVFGFICLRTWLEENNTCPLCRGVLFSCELMRFIAFAAGLPSNHFSQIPFMAEIEYFNSERTRNITEAILGWSLVRFASHLSEIRNGPNFDYGFGNAGSDGDDERDHDDGGESDGSDPSDCQAYNMDDIEEVLPQGEVVEMCVIYGDGTETMQVQVDHSFLESGSESEDSV